MKWFTHQTVALGAGICIGLPWSGLAGAFVGAVLPDVLDQRLAGLFPNRQKAFNRIHRGTTHWFGWWLSLLALAALPAVPPLAKIFIAGLSFGGLLHVLLDLCTIRGVPLWPWGGRPRPALRLCRTGGFSEYVFLLAACALFGYLQRGPLLETLNGLIGTSFG